MAPKHWRHCSTSSVGPMPSSIARGGDASAVEAARRAFARIDQVLDIVPERREADAELSGWVGERLAARVAARQARNFALSDAIRDELATRGVMIEDGAGETRWKLR